MELIITTLFGLESLVKDDLTAIGYDVSNIEVQDGMVILHVPEKGIATAVARLNLWVRRGERVLLSIGTFSAVTFDEFFEQIAGIPWEEYIPDSFAFHVNGYSRKSALFSVSACQSLCKKAIVKRLLVSRGQLESAQLCEDAFVGILKIQFGIVSDTVRMMIDTSGEGLHKRGYRPLMNQAPIKETLAAGLVSLSRYEPFDKEALVDPFCGSGTIVIEAAMMALRIAPGWNRHFSSEKWPFIGEKVFAEARLEADSFRRKDPPSNIYFFGSDNDVKAVETANRNAVAAKVSEYVSFKESDAFAQTPEALLSWTGLPRQLILCNPPYGGRLLTPDEAQVLFAQIADTYLDEARFCKKGMRLSVISPDDSFEIAVGRSADKRRKLYNGNIRCQMNHYYRMQKST